MTQNDLLNKNTNQLTRQNIVISNIQITIARIHRFI